MAHALDFQQLKQAHSIVDVLAMLGITHLTERGDTMRGCCPICKNPDQRAFVVTPEKGTYYCFKERKGGDIIRLVAAHDGIEDRAAAARISAHFSGTGKADNSARPQQEVADGRKASGFDPLAYLETLDAAHEALIDLGLSPETLRAFKAGYSSKGLNRGRLAVAWCGMDGEIKAFVGVALKGEEPPYLLPKGMPTPYWFGCHRIDDGAELRIVSSLLELLIATEHGASNLICPLAPTNGDALTSLKALVDIKNLTVEF
jgi:hypothetical protein